MALVAMACYDPPNESRHELLDQCLHSIAGEFMGKKNHRLLITGQCLSHESRAVIDHFRDMIDLFDQNYAKNIGTAHAINRAWQLRKPGEHCVKMDSDVVIRESGWLDKLEEAISQDPKLGIIALKRRDLDESPHQPPNSWARSELKMLPHVKGQRWHTVEKVHHAIGTCQLYNSALLDKVGFLVQMGPYGFDDSLMGVRCKVAGFYSAFYCNIDIEHPDPGGTPYTQWKIDQATKHMQRYHEICNEYRTGKRSVYHGPDEDLA